MAIQKFRVDGLTRADAARIKARLHAIGGVLFVCASYGNECAEVEFEDDAVTTETLRDAIHELGFEVRLAG